MKLGFMSAILPEYSFGQIIDFSSETGMECVELACWPQGKSERRYAGVTHIDADCYDKASILEKLAETKIRISGLGYYPNPLTPDPAQMDVYISHLKKLVSTAKDLGVENVNTFIGKDKDAGIAENFTEFRKVWPDIIGFAEQNGVNICIENCPMYFTENEAPGGNNLAATPAIWEEMFSIIDSENFGLNYDPSHLVVLQMDYVKPIYQFAEKIRHFHIKDAKFYKEKYDQCGFFAPPLEYHKPKLPGRGDICWGSVFSALSDIGYKGPAVIEIEDRAFEDTLEDKLRSIVLAMRFVEQYII
jgi:sugar phosphate isomerase/epimerase